MIVQNTLNQFLRDHNHVFQSPYSMVIYESDKHGNQYLHLYIHSIKSPYFYKINKEGLNGFVYRNKFSKWIEECLITTYDTDFKNITIKYIK